MYILRKHLSRDKTRSTGRLSHHLRHLLRYPFLRLPQGYRPVYSTAENWAVAAKNWASFPLVANVAALRWGCLGGPPSFDLSDSAPLASRCFFDEKIRRTI